MTHPIVSEPLSHPQGEPIRSAVERIGRGPAGGIDERHSPSLQAQYSGQPWLREQFEEYRAPGRCTLIGGGKTSADQAALFNSGLVRYVDLLDSYMAPGGLCHPSDNFGTVLAAAEQAGASGEEFMLALAVAYEIQCRFSAAVR
jgi:2-methylcitrate dehydratase PrpD